MHLKALGTPEGELCNGYWGLQAAGMAHAVLSPPQQFLDEVADQGIHVLEVGRIYYEAALLPVADQTGGREVTEMK